MRRLIAAVALGAAVAAAGPLRADEDQTPYAHTMYAIVKQIRSTELVVQIRSGRLVAVDISSALRAHRTGVLYVNRAVALHGDYDAAHAFHAVAITGAAGLHYTPAAWPQDE
jgi:hypothetical protein